MANYYFLGTLLPELQIGERPEISFTQFEQLLKDNLSEADYAKMRTIRNFYDIFNLRSYWKKAPMDPAGNLTANELEEALATRSFLPPYVFEYLDKYESKEDLLRHFPELYGNFFRTETQRASKLLKFYLGLERELRLVLVAFRAKKLGRDVAVELQYEDPEDPLVAQILAQKDAPQFEPPEKYQEIKGILEKYKDDPIGLQKALSEFRFGKIEERLGIDMFSIDRLMGYLVELLIVEKWQRLDKQKGLEIVDSMLKEPS